MTWNRSVRDDWSGLVQRADCRVAEGGQLDCTLPPGSSSETKLLKTRSEPSVQTLFHLAVGSLWLYEWKCHADGQQVPMGPLCKERHKAGGHSEGHSCKTSDHLPSTRLPAQSDMTRIISLSARIHWWLYPNWNLSLLPHSELISFLFNLAPLICHLFVKAVLNLCQRSMELRLYITAGSSVFCRESTLSLPKPLPPCQLTRSLSTEVIATTNANETPHSPPVISHQPSANGNGYFFFLHIPVNTLPNS